MRWREQQEMLENIIRFHQLDIDPCDFDWALGKAEQRMREMRQEIRKAGW